MNLLRCRDIKRLWKVAGQRYTAPKQQAAAAVGPDYSLWHVSLVAGITLSLWHWHLSVRCSVTTLGMCMLRRFCASMLEAMPCLPDGVAALPPSHNNRQDLPTSISQLSHFRGKAALPTHALGISSFGKAFFLHPDTEVGVIQRWSAAWLMAGLMQGMAGVAWRGMECLGMAWHDTAWPWACHSMAWHGAHGGMAVARLLHGAA